MERVQYIEKIRSNISVYGHHISIVSGGPEPRYAYTIGLTERYGLELILAGGIYYLSNDVYTIINGIAEQISKADLAELENRLFLIDLLGEFKLELVHPSWSGITMFGVGDFYNRDSTRAFQIIPDKFHLTLDVPRMSREWSEEMEPSWKWLKMDWDFNISPNVTVVTNLGALKGETITEVMRWENEEWEMFAGPGPDVKKEEIRIVPIGLLFGIDSSLISALNIEVNKGIWREGMGHEWQSWG